MYETCNCSIPNCGCAGGMHTYKKYYQKILELVKPKVVMEWGPGPNTQMALNSGAIVTSVESEKKWIPEGSNNRWSCILLPTDHPMYTSTWPVADAAQADLYFVDGRRRSECLEQISKLPVAIACLHDAQRNRYRYALDSFKYAIHLIYGFAIASNDERVIHIADTVSKEV